MRSNRYRRPSSRPLKLRFMKDLTLFDVYTFLNAFLHVISSNLWLIYGLCVLVRKNVIFSPKLGHKTQISSVFLFYFWNFRTSKIISKRSCCEKILEMLFLGGI